MKTINNAPHFVEDREFYFILTGSFLFYLLLIFFFYVYPFDLNHAVPKLSLPARKITMIIPSQAVSKPLPPPVEKPEKKKPPVPIVPKKVIKPVTPPAVEKIKPEPKKEIPAVPKETPEEIQRKKQEELAIQQAKEREKNQEVAKNKFASLFGNTTDEVLQNKGLNLISTKNPSSSPVNKGNINGASPDDLQIQIKNQDVDRILKGLPSGRDKKSSALLGEHQTKNFETGGRSEKIANIRSPEDLERTINAYKGRLKSYYDKAIQAEPSLKGKMRVRITLAADGHVLKCEVLSSSLNNKQFENEIAQIIQDQFKFSQIAQGEEYYDTPLNFQPDK